MGRTTRRLRMRNGRWIGLGFALACAMATVAPCSATSIPVGPPVALGPRALALAMEGNPEIAMYIERRGYPDWAEEIEVDSELPLDAHEIRLYYLRLDKEIAVARASLLGR